MTKNPSLSGKNSGNYIEKQQPQDRRRGEKKEKERGRVKAKRGERLQ
jgi:hypothetical protein